jgi:uncharacterized protein YigE (DUF2233 family)
MIKSINYTILLLVLLFTLICPSGITISLAQVSQPVKKTTADTSLISTFHELLDRVCEVKSTGLTAELLLKKTLDSVELLAAKIETGNKDRSRYSVARSGNPPNSKSDSTKVKVDSLNRSVPDPNKERINYDSLISSTEQRIKDLQKRNRKLTKSVDSLRVILAKSQSALELSLRRIRPVASMITGSLSCNVCGVDYLVYIADLDSVDIALHLFFRDKQNFRSLGSVADFLRNNGRDPLMITNAGMYTTSNEPLGLYIESGRKNRYKLNKERNHSGANFYLEPNGVFLIDTCNTAHIETTDDYKNHRQNGDSDIKIATQSGPMLVINDTIHPRFTKGSANRKIRSGVGILSGRRVVFALTLDESNFYDFATFFRDIFGCRNALFLDGAISRMYLKDINPGETGGDFGPMISISKKK